MPCSGPMRVRFRYALVLMPLALAACGGGGGARLSYRAPGVRNYTPPGPTSDPWGPYIREAAARYAVPETFVRAVMRQESGGHEYLNGQLITSSAGAMGLMQVMPATYEVLRERNDLGPDPYDPHDNILAGTALIRDLYAKYGSPAFLAAYDAGPRRLDDYLAGRGELPNETIAYLDNVAPRLVGASPMTGPLVAFAGNPGEAPPVSPVATEAPVEVAEAPPPDTTAAGSQVWSPAPQSPQPPPPPAPVQVAELGPPPTQNVRMVLTPPPLPAHPSRFALIPSAYADTIAPNTRDDRWGVQVGAFTDPHQARQVVESARNVAPAQLAPARTTVGAVTHPDGQVFYRARLVGITQPAADNACRTLSSHAWPCLAVPPGG
jgi:D-alanyl-D-alanine carboxypeptidase